MSSSNGSPSIVLVGLNHRTAPVEVREQFAFASEELAEAVTRLTASSGMEEGLILSTCNRVEVYGVSDQAEAAIAAIKRFLSASRRMEMAAFDRHFYTHAEPQSVKHLFRVACGLDSMVVGEHEILGQVKRSYEVALARGATKKVLNALLQKSFHVAKRVRTETGIGRGACSVSTVAVELAEKIFADLSRQTVMIVGAGKMGMQAAKYLAEQGSRRALIANRSCDKAQALATAIGGYVVPWASLRDALVDADIVISSTGASGYLLSKDDVVQLMRRRRNRSLFFIDIAVPRNIDPAINTIDNVYLYDIDDLTTIVSAHLAGRLSALENCQAIIDRKADQFMAWLAAESRRVDVSQA